MPSLLAVLTLLLLTGCASDQYSSVPEPSGEWVPANPPPPVMPTAGASRLISASGEHAP